MRVDGPGLKKCGGGVGGAGCGVEGGSGWVGGATGNRYVFGITGIGFFLFFTSITISTFFFFPSTFFFCSFQRTMSRNAYYSMDHIRAHRIYPPSPPNTATATSTPTSPQNFMPLKTDSSEKWYPSRQQPQIHSQRLLEDDAYFNLDKVVQQYGEQPELLELILSSKLEEDRRRAEEAKLRQKEIDYMLQQQQPLQPSRQKRPAEMLPRIKSFAAVDNGWRNTSPPPPPAAHIQQSHPQEQRRNSSLLLSQPIITTPNATSPSVHTPSTTSTTTNSTPTLPPILSPYEPSVPVHPPYPGPSPIFRRDSAR